MDATRQQRLAQLQTLFAVTEVGGKAAPDEAAAETIAAYLNRKYGRPVVIRRARKG